MTKSDKMDRHGARTAANIEQKYNFGKSFAEAVGIAKKAEEVAQKAASSSDELDEKLTSTEIFNRLTENGKLQGIFKDDDGNIMINGAFIQALDKLFAKDINMSGCFTYSTRAFIEPGTEEIETLQAHLQGNITIPTELQPLYDTNNDGQITLADMSNMRLAQMGLYSLAAWAGESHKSDITLTIDLKNPEKVIRISGKNMWGRTIDSYIGVNFTSIRNPSTEQKLDQISQEITKIKNHLGIT